MLPLKFVTLFLPAENVHLVKDVGQIPWFMHKCHGYSASIVCFKNNPHYPFLETEARGLQLQFLQPSGKRYFLELAVVDYLRQNARDIDVLNVYHLNRDTFYYGNLYKNLNPNGVLYCKLDLANEFLRSGKKKHSANFFKNLVFRKWESEFIQNVDLFSIENSEGLALMKQRYPACAGKIFLMPNGVNNLFIEQHFPKSIKKENIVLIAGRIGIVRKNHEILLRVIPHLKLKGWQFIFAGPVVERFKPKVKAFYDEFPELRSSVRFIGDVDDRKTMYDWFRRSKITCLTSFEESFGLVFTEGLYFGNYLIGNHNMNSFDDISNNGKFGVKLPVNDDEALRQILQHLIDNPHEMDQVRPAAEQFAREHFTWPKLVNRLNAKIKQRISAHVVAK